MSKSGVGVGSASIVLVFAVLCLTIFSLITFVVAGNEKALVDAKVGLVTGYYEADSLAEFVLAEILTAETVPENVRGVDINTRWDDGLNAETIYFFCHISDVKALFVNLLIHENTFDILCWQMYDTDDWEFDDSINVWTGG